MKIKILIYNIGLMFLILNCVSCKKYLDKKSNNSLVVPTKLEDLQGLLDDATLMNELVTPSFSEASADDYFMLQATYDTRSTREQKVYTWMTADYTFQNDWSTGYSPVYNSNYCLEMIEKISITGENELIWKNVKGSALFFRAYNFLNLAWTYGNSYDESSSESDLGIALRLGSDFNVKSSRSSLKATYDRIIQDAKDALLYLPNTSAHSYRPSKAAAYGLLARTFLSMRLYENALKYSDSCLQLKNQLIDYNGDAEFLGVSASFPFSKFNKETIFYSEMNQLIGTLSIFSLKVDTVLFSGYNSNDLRKSAYFTPSSGYQRFKGSYTQSARYFSGIATDEMYLIRAECFARIGNKDASLSDLNTLLGKRWKSGFFVPVTAINPQDALNKVLIERRKELYLRGLRWMDIKRLNKEGASIILKRVVSGQTILLQPNSNYYALPLPTDIINISGMPQNPN
jgi:tetratricopeptide (TPR) repeat protein